MEPNIAGQHSEGQEDSTAWAVPFADMMTLLLTLFVLLLVILNEVQKQVDAEINKLLDKAYEQLQEGLTEDDIDLAREGKGIKITIRGKLFESLSADIKPKYYSVIGKIGTLIKKTDLMNIDYMNTDSTYEYFTLLSELERRDKELGVEIRCEGHTDDAALPEKSEFESNWELSSARSLKVVRLINQYASLPEQYFSALGYGEYRPVISAKEIKKQKKKNDRQRLRSYNRRVEIYFSAYSKDKTQSSEEDLIEMLTGKKKKRQEIEVVKEETS